MWQEARPGSIRSGDGDRCGWCLPMEVTAGNFGMIFAQENLRMAHVNAFGRLPELLRGFTVSVWSARTAQKRPK